jgi:hypothetical protein
VNFKLAQTHWLKPLQRFLGIGLVVNAVGIQSKVFLLSPDLIEHWYEDNLVWLRSIGLTDLNITSEGVKGLKDWESYPFVVADKKLRKSGFKALSYLSIHPAPSLIKVGSASIAPKIGASLRNALRIGDVSFFLRTWEDSIQFKADNIFRSHCQWACSLNLLDYAIALHEGSRSFFQSDAVRSAFTKPAVKTSTGLSSSSYSAKQVIDAGGHTLDYLGEIYPLQILSSVHVSRRIGDRSLKEWIESSPEHGSLSAFSEKHWIWEIPNDLIESIRKAMSQHGLLTLYLPDMNRIFEDYESDRKR